MTRNRSHAFGNARNAYDLHRLREESIVGDVGMLADAESIARDSVLGEHSRSILPLTGRINTTRTTRRTLGEGTYGRVNLESNAHGDVATKYFTSIESINENITEIATLKFLKGLPNIAQLIRVEPGAFPAVVMGKAVDTLQYSSLFTSWDAVLSTIKQVLSGFQVLRSQNVIHRDIKPGNMLMTVTGEVWITDFGTACFIPPYALMPSDLYTGTIPYAAPELLLNLFTRTHETIDYFKSDAWAVGVSLYQILTNTYLFEGDDHNDILKNIFRIKGTPTSTDGIVFKLYNLAYQGSAKVGSGIRARCLAHSTFKHRDELPLVADIISGLCAYNPDLRLTVEQALQRLNVVAFKKPIAHLLVEYGDTMQISEEHLAKLFDWLQIVAIHDKYNKVRDKRQLPFVLDRMCVYIQSFLTVVPTPLRELQLVGIVGFFLANCFFGDKRDVHAMVRLCDAYTIDQIYACINQYLVADIYFFGTTVFDQLLKNEPHIDERIILMYGFLNMACFQMCVEPDFRRFREFRDANRETSLAAFAKTVGESRELLAPFFAKIQNYAKGGRRTKRTKRTTVRHTVSHRK